MADTIPLMQERWNTSAERYDTVDVHGVNDPREIDEWTAILQTIGEPPKRMLDVGTGTGFVALLAAELGYTVTALDFAPGMMDQAKEKALKKARSIRFVESSTETLPFPDGDFDAVVSRHVLWTLTQPREALKEWHRVLRPNGVVLADYSPRTPGAAGQHYAAEIEAMLPLNRDVPPEEVQSFFVAVGFTDVDFRSIRAYREGPRGTFLFRGTRP